MQQAQDIRSVLQREHPWLLEKHPGLAEHIAQHLASPTKEALLEAIDGLKEACLHADRLASRWAFNESAVRPRGYARPVVPLAFQPIIAREVETRELRHQVSDNLASVRLALLVACKLYLDFYATTSVTGRTVLLDAEQGQFRLLSLTAEMSEEQFFETGRGLAKKVCEIDPEQFNFELFFVELSRQGFAMSAPMTSFNFNNVDTFDFES